MSDIICTAQIFPGTGAIVKMERRQSVESVVRALRRVNFQGSIFGQSVAIRLGLSESDVDALELLVDTGAATAGKLAELMGLTTGAVTRVVDRLEQAGYVRRVSDPTDRRRVIVEIIPEKVTSLEAMMASLEQAAEEEAGRYTPDQLATINDFLSRMAELTQAESTRLRTTTEDPTVAGGPSEHVAPLGSLTDARLTFRSGAQDLRMRAGRAPAELVRARFDGATPQVRVRDGRVLVQYRGIPFDWRKRTATLALNATIPWAIEVVGGIDRIEADLRDLTIRRFEVTGGSERCQLEFGRPHGEVPIKLTGGARTLRIERPTSVPVRLRIVGGASSVVVDDHAFGSRGGETIIEPPGWSAATDRYALEVIGGTKSITVVGQG
jgi:DNA-binding MarR family transcriptional regulator